MLAPAKLLSVSTSIMPLLVLVMLPATLADAPAPPEPATFSNPEVTRLPPIVKLTGGSFSPSETT
jgi:hypothetical protein